MPCFLARLAFRLSLSLLLLGPYAASSQPSFRIAYNASTAPLVPLVREVYREMGMQPEFLLLPAERALTGTDRGDYDADLSRAGGSVQAYVHLMQTREPLRKTELYAYAAKGSRLIIRDARDLKEHSLGLQHGAKLAEEFIRAEHLSAERGHSPEALYAMLAAGRFEIALVTSIQARAHSKTLDLQAQRVSGPLVTGYSFHVLNKMHAALAPKFDAALLALKKSGQAERLLAPDSSKLGDLPLNTAP